MKNNQKEELNDVLSFIETCGFYNDSDFAEEEKLNKEQQDIFDGF